jgi:hypothetical protein
MVPEERIELSRACARRILSPLRLPISPLRLKDRFYTELWLHCQYGSIRGELNDLGNGSGPMVDPLRLIHPTTE